MERANIEIVRGDSPLFDIIVTTNSGVIFDLTGYTMCFTARKQNKTIVKTEGDGIVISNAINGNAVLTLDPEDTDETGRYDFDIQINNNSRVHTVSLGEINIINDVTKSVPVVS